MSANEDSLANYLPFRGTKRYSNFDSAQVNAIIAILFAVALLAGASRDRALFLTPPSVGLSRHPGIWWFLIGQVWLPFVVRKSVASFHALRHANNNALSSDYLSARFDHEAAFLDAWVERRSNLSRLTYALLVAIGCCAWAWNTYSNQHPATVGFDFWDSSHHFWSYTITRFYKAYVWMWLMPALVHIQTGLILTLRAVLRDASENKGLVLEPFHADGTGGLSVFVDTALNPMIPTVFVGSMISLSAVLVHRRYDITTVGGLSLACFAFVALYFVPGTELRKAAKQEKRRQITDITRVQQHLYEQISSTSGAGLSDDVDAMIGLSAVVDKIRTLPEWPQLRAVIRLAVLAWSSPSVLWVANKAFERLTVYFAV